MLVATIPCVGVAGRLLHVLPARDQPVQPDAPTGKHGSSFKKSQAEKRAANSGNDSNWNTMFLRSATVAVGCLILLAYARAGTSDACPRPSFCRTPLRKSLALLNTRFTPVCCVVAQLLCGCLVG